jgi:hypothetical protein
VTNLLGIDVLYFNCADTALPGLPRTVLMGGIRAFC